MARSRGKFPVDPNGRSWYFDIIIVYPVSDRPNNPTSDFLEIYEMDFPEMANMKASRPTHIFPLKMEMKQKTA